MIGSEGSQHTYWTDTYPPLILKQAWNRRGISYLFQGRNNRGVV